MNAFKQIMVADRQSLTDIAMQEYGCYEALFILLEDNADRLFAVDEVLIEGMKLNIRADVPDINPFNKAIVSEYIRSEHKVVSHGIGTPHVINIVADYVTTDYMDTTYSTAPAEIRNLQIVANIRRLYGTGSSNMHG